MCFPGTPQNATCTYSLQTGTSPDEDLEQAQQQSCPQGFLFQQPCDRLLGSMTIAFGKCNLNDPVVERRENNTLDVAIWMDVLGLRKLQVHVLHAGQAIQTEDTLLRGDIMTSAKFIITLKMTWHETKPLPSMPSTFTRNVWVLMQGRK